MVRATWRHDLNPQGASANITVPSGRAARAARKAISPISMITSAMNAMISSPSSMPIMPDADLSSRGPAALRRSRRSAMSRRPASAMPMRPAGPPAAGLYAEASLHGSLQAGYNNGWAPLCIGSHYAVRTASLEEDRRARSSLREDHSTTLMNAGGWRGVHAVNAIAHGDGPATFADLVVQEFQWSRSLVTILLHTFSPACRPAAAELKFQFLFSQLWYPLFSTFMAVMFLLPVTQPCSPAMSSSTSPIRHSCCILCRFRSC